MNSVLNELLRDADGTIVGLATRLHLKDERPDDMFVPLTSIVDGLSKYVALEPRLQDIVDMLATFKVAKPSLCPRGSQLSTAAIDKLLDALHIVRGLKRQPVAAE